MFSWRRNTLRQAAPRVTSSQSSSASSSTRIYAMGKFHSVPSDSASGWSYCTIARCRCDHPKRCTSRSCDCDRPKVCDARACDCGFPKVCPTPSCNCGLPKIATGKHATAIDPSSEGSTVYNCPRCKMRVDKDANVCPYCHLLFSDGDGLA